MNDAQTRAAQWLRASRAAETQETLAADIERVTGWHITRDRYSKYESGSIPMGRAVLARFVDYWASRGKPGPEVMGSAGGDDTSTPVDLAPYLARIDALVRTVELQNAMLVQVLSGPAPATMKRLKAWSTSVLARVESSPSLPQTPDADGSPA